jgi:hypothetical protein
VKALLTLCDTLLLFNWKLDERDEDLETLVCHVDDDLENRIIQFVVDNVFCEADNELGTRSSMYISSVFEYTVANFQYLDYLSTNFVDFFASFQQQNN